ncbi:MAG: glucose-1-phosphate cytidylyltransferase [Acidobacteriota bacterium]|nr:MAG: glucose-1-phosphate cytidylyltransferase [Acidobacteriota bacterium]
MKVVIFAGGLGSRLSEETESKPKPMVEIGGRPILWHIMKHYAHYGLDEFVVALGYRGDVIKRWFLDKAELDGSFTLSLRDRQVVRHDEPLDDWKLSFIDTGVETQTGGRLARVAPMLRDGTFMLTYGDGVSSIDLGELLAFHRAHGKLATVTAVRPPARFGELEFDGDRVKRFSEKPQIGEGWINGGFFVLEPGALDVIPGDVHWEREPLERLAEAGELMAYRHESFWQCMDTLRDKRLLESLWANGPAPWKVWP